MPLLTVVFSSFLDSVWLPDPAAFFQLFQGIESTTDAATSKLFFGKAGKKKPQNALADAAFGLLQWAQHGESYDFAAPILVDDNSSSSSEEEEEEEEELLEDNVEHPTTEEEPHVPEWTARLETTTAQPTQYQEMDAPKEFKPQLRPYQKQALWWMTQRESQTELEEWSRHQLQLLQELATSSSSSSTSSSSSSSDVEILPPPQKVHCDCGPVYVDASAISAPAVTDNGTSPDLNHPLWERRYLASPDRDQALSFYVQPLFGMAVASPPPPPQPCRGGILADAMGLGKTVMLLALIQSTIKGGGSRRRTTTLIVSPLSLLAQWEEELVSKTNLSYRVHYGDNKKNSHDFDAVDVVLTTCKYIRIVDLPQESNPFIPESLTKPLCML